MSATSPRTPSAGEKGPGHFARGSAAYVSTCAREPGAASPSMALSALLWGGALAPAGACSSPRCANAGVLFCWFFGVALAQREPLRSPRVSRGLRQPARPAAAAVRAAGLASARRAAAARAGAGGVCGRRGPDGPPAWGRRSACGPARLGPACGARACRRPRRPRACALRGILPVHGLRGWRAQRLCRLPRRAARGRFRRSRALSSSTSFSPGRCGRRRS